MNNTSSSSKLKIPVFEFIDLHPSPIKHISTSNNKIYVSREKCSEVYSFIDAPSLQKTSVEQVLRLEPAEQIFEINNILVMIKPFELKVYDEDKGVWGVFPFTTQFYSACFLNNFLYTFHEKQSLRWSIDEDSGIRSHFLQKNEAPYHINPEGEVEGFGKKIKSSIKTSKFTVVELSACSKYLFIGDDQGHLQIFQTKFLTHVKTIRRHEASILTIKATENFVFFTGSDSKISSLSLVKSDENVENWTLSTEVRAQSHDILSISLLRTETSTDYLISGGVTTDLCLYPLNNGMLGEQWAHKISYSSEKLVDCVDQFLFVNKFNTLEIWKVLPDQPEYSKNNIQLLVRYELPQNKHIQQLTVTPFDQRQSFGKTATQYLIMISTQYEAVNWLFGEESGLTKFSTISNSYTLVRPMGGESFLTLRDGNRLEKLDLRSGRIKELTEVNVPLVTDMFIHYNGEEKKILLASKYSQKMEVYTITKGKGCKLSIKLDLKAPYNIMDICYQNPQNFIVKFSNENLVQEMNNKGQLVREVVKLPVKKIRQHGWAQVLLEGKKKVYWYLVGETKIVIVSGMKTLKEKKVRVKQMPRIGNVIGNPLALSSFGGSEMENEWQANSVQRWSLGVIALNMGKMISQQPIKPVVTKKIL